MADVTCEVGEQFYAEVTFNEHFCEFEIFEDMVGDGETMTPVMTGSVKFDGCSNVEYHPIMHYCEPRHFMNQNEILRQCYNACAEHFNNTLDPEVWDKLPLWSNTGE